MFSLTVIISLEGGKFFSSLRFTHIILLFFLAFRTYNLLIANRQGFGSVAKYVIYKRIKNRSKSSSDDSKEYQCTKPAIILSLYSYIYLYVLWGSLNINPWIPKSPFSRQRFRYNLLRCYILLMSPFLAEYGN